MELRAIMFVDMVDSTVLKHRETTATALLLTKVLFELVHAAVRETGLFVKFTGDGAMVTFEGTQAGCQSAIAAAKDIIQSMDEYNLRFHHGSKARPGAFVNIQVRIGIAFGECDRIEPSSEDVVGQPADLASRLSHEGDINRILVDQRLMKMSGLGEGHFESLNRRRLALKGIPLPEGAEPERFYLIHVDRLVRGPLEAGFSGGMIAVYTNRQELSHDFGIARLFELAQEGSELLVVGRTLVGWSRIGETDLALARAKGLRLKLLVSSMEACKVLAGNEVTSIIADKASTLPAFQRMTSTLPDSISFLETDSLIPDGFTCAHVKVGRTTKHVVLRDINSGPKTDKITMLFACICDRDHSRESRCITCGMRERGHRLFDQATKSALPRAM